MTRIPWTERRFSFDFAVGVYPEVMERLRGTPARVADRLRPVPQPQLTRRAGPAWSLQEHAGHLSDLDLGLFAPRIGEYLVGVATLRPADMTNQATEAADHNARPLDQVLATLAASRRAVVERLEALAPGSFGLTAHHPRLGRTMRLVDLMYFQAEHDDYHLATITELLRRAPG